MSAHNDSVFFPFSVDTSSGCLRLESDYEAYVRQLIRQVLLTAPGERLNRPQFGAGVRRLLFAPLATSASLAGPMIYQALEGWLSSVITVNDVQVSSTEIGRLDLVVIYTVRATNERRYLNEELTI